MTDDQQKRVVIYTRVSTDDEKQKTSPENQAEACRNICRAKGWSVVEVIGDEGISGTTMNRPGWRHVTDLVKMKLVDVVVKNCWCREGARKPFEMEPRSA